MRRNFNTCNYLIHVSALFNNLLSLNIFGLSLQTLELGLTWICLKMLNRVNRTLLIIAEYIIVRAKDNTLIVSE